MYTSNLTKTIISLSILTALQARAFTHTFYNKTPYDIKIKVDVAFGFDKEVVIPAGEEKKVNVGLHFIRGYIIRALMAKSSKTFESAMERTIVATQEKRILGHDCTVGFEPIQGKSGVELVRFFFINRKPNSGNNVEL